MTPIRVLVVEDSLTIRRHIVEALEADPAFQVVGEADDGPEAIALCARLRPDVMTLDMVLRTTSGLEVTEHVMAHCPTPILIVSASLNRGEVWNTFDALSAGAVDVLDKAGADDEAPDATWEERLLRTVRLVSRIKVITHVRARLGLPGGPPVRARPGSPPRGSLMAAPPVAGLQAPPLQAGASAAPRLVAVGASTGGPSAVIDILRGLPAAYPLPILLVIHIGAPFGASFIEWLSGQTPLRVRAAADGMPLPPPGTPGVIMAPPDRHLVVEGARLRLTSAPERHSCRPSVDVLFESVAREVGAAAIGCLLTGMGRDGAAGLLAMRHAGAATIAQDEATSMVWGMPREAALLGAPAQVLPLERIAGALEALTPR